MKVRWIGLTLAVTAGASQSQGPAPVPRFEVASVRQCGYGASHTQAKSTPGRLTLTCWPLSRIIQEAYDVFANGKVNPLNPSFPMTPMEGVPDWMNSADYTINATTEEPQSVAMMRGPIMQRLLEDRFRLQVHRETRQTAVYLMTVAPGGAKLQATKENSCNHLDTTDLTQSLKLMPGARPWCVIASPTKNGSHFVWDVSGMGTTLLAGLLKIGGIPAIDRTGLTGTFDIHLEWEFVPAEAGDPPDLSIVSAIRKQLGLQLTLGKGPREFLVIDHLERPLGN